MVRLLLGCLESRAVTDAPEYMMLRTQVLMFIHYIMSCYVYVSFFMIPVCKKSMYVDMIPVCKKLCMLNAPSFLYEDI